VAVASGTGGLNEPPPLRNTGTVTRAPSTLDCVRMRSSHPVATPTRAVPWVVAYLTTEKAT
jgi:hypothetical protein